MRYLFILMLFFVSCSPQKRISRILKKHPELIYMVDTEITILDTIVEMDTFITQEHKDSFIITTDTIIETDRIIIERIKDRFNVIIKTDTFMRLDTMYYTKTIKVKGKVIKVNRFPSWFWWFIAISVCLIIYGIYRKS